MNPGSHATLIGTGGFRSVPPYRGNLLKETLISSRVQIPLSEADMKVVCCHIQLRLTIQKLITF